MTTQQGRPPIRRPRQDREKPPPGLRVGDYTLLSRIGEGGMGVVHLARRPGGERVALKVLRPHIVGDDEARARLAREVSSLTRVRSRWVAEILDADPWADVPYVATRYVPGLSLHDHVLAEGPITGADLTWFAGCLAEGLASVHDAGVLHRDVKPSNVLMEGRTPILIDFGLARVADDPKLTHTGWLLGTPGYLAPEILYGDDASAASDVHSWAATVAYAGTGRAPFGRGPSMAIMDRVRRGEHDLDRPARRPARPGRGGARPGPGAAPDAGAAGGVAAPADHPDPAGAAPGAGHDGAARGPLHGAALAGGAGARAVPARAAHRRAAAPAGAGRRRRPRLLPVGRRGRGRARRPGVGRARARAPDVRWGPGSAGCCSSSPASCSWPAR